MQLTKDDYRNILEYYEISLPRKATAKALKHKAEDILAKKLCRCIKKVEPYKSTNEGRAIAICKKTLFTNRNLITHRFKCKKPQLLPKKGTKLMKTKRNIKLGRKTRKRRRRYR